MKTITLTAQQLEAVARQAAEQYLEETSGIVACGRLLSREEQAELQLDALDKSVAAAVGTWVFKEIL